MVRVSWRQDAEVRAGERALGPQWLTVEQLQLRWGRSAAMITRRTWVNIAVCPCLQLISQAQQTSTLSRIKCERYIFIKKRVRSFIEVRILCLIMFLLIFVLRLCNTTIPFTLPNLWGSFQVHQLQLISLLIPCFTTFLVFWRGPSTCLCYRCLSFSLCGPPGQ